jgi:hypothetical protein
VSIPTSAGGSAGAEKHYDDDDWDARHRTKTTWFYSNGSMHKSKYPAPPSLHQSSTRSAAYDQKMHIFISDMNNMSLMLEVLPSDTIDMVKQKIQDLKQIPKDEHQLWYQSNILEEKHTLEYYHIDNMTTLYLHDRQIKIFIKRGGGDDITLDVLPSDTIKMVKQKIQDRKNIPKDKQDLFYVRKKLMDWYTLKAYNINNMSTLHLSEWW